MEVSKADMIVSLAGRDKGQLFFVIDTDDPFESSGFNAVLSMID